MSVTFTCSYCNKLHPIEWKSEEHIIPKALKNENYVLPNVCRKLNNYMSHSFEKKVLKFDIVKLILLLIDPPPKPIYFTEVQTELDRKIHSYILPSGELELTGHPTYREKNTVDLLIKGKDGKTYPYKLTFPFIFKGGISGNPRMVVERDRVIEQEKNKINNYLKELSENPEINESFSEFLKEINGEYIFEQLNIIEKELLATPPIQLSEPVVRTIQVDNESLFKLFLKIAWTHGYNQLGIEKFSNPISDLIFQYITTGHIIDISIINDAPELFTKSVKIENEDFIFWKYGLDETMWKIEELSDQIDINNLLGYYFERYHQFDLLQNLIIFNYIREFNPKLIESINDYRFHDISLRTDDFEGLIATVCHLQLFGGIFDVKIKLSEIPLSDIYPPNIRVKF